MGNSAEYGKVVNLIEERPVHHSLKNGPPGQLIAGDSMAFLDILLTNHKGEEKLVRVPVGFDTVEFLRA